MSPEENDPQAKLFGGEGVGCVLPPPLPARMHFRSIAFFMDALLVFLLSVVVVQWVLVPMLGEQTRTELYAFWYDYRDAVEQVQAGQVKMDEALAEMTITPMVERAVLAIFATIFFTFWGYLSLSEWLMKGETLGKKAFHLRTIHLPERRPPNLLEALVRGGLKSISLLALFFVPEILTGNILSMLIALLTVDYILAFYHPSRRTLHDMAVRSTVVEPANPALLDELA